VPSVTRPTDSRSPPARRDLPSGTVTFLFTDIEGSTRLLSELGEEYVEALAEHRRVLRESFERHGGVEVDTQGDAFFVAFSSAGSAVGAAAEAQEQLALPVRMGLHTGEPQITDEGYVGLDVHEAARICGVAHGGQVVLSQQARHAYGRDHEIRDLGLHRLKDIPEPVRLYQVGDREFPPLRSLNATNLPALMNPLVGRESELEDVRVLLGDGVRLVTLTGAGGTGKTRLALEAAAGLADDFPDGVFWAPLASVRKPELALATVEETIGAKTALAQHVDQKQMLLLLDNFERLLPAATELAALLARCPNLKLLVTSRAPLRLSGEHELLLPPLPNEPAVVLFMQRARAVRPDLETTEAVSEICDRLDGLPLAIELAAPRVRVLELDDLLAQLERRLPLLTGGPQDVPARQRTLRATIEWSYELLDAAEQTALARLAVFAGGWDTESAEVVSETGFETLESLAEQSLILFRGGRFFMLETIREFALEQLEDRGEEEEFRLRHALYFVERAERLGPEIAGPEARAPLAALQRNSSNLLDALAWLVSTGRAELAMRLGGALGMFWHSRGHGSAVRPLLEQAIELDGSVAPSVRGPALRVLARRLSMSGELKRSRVLEQRAQQLFEEAGDARGVARCLLDRAWDHMDLSELEEAGELATKARQLTEEIGDRPLQGLAENHLGLIAMRRGDLAAAARHIEKARELWHEAGNLIAATAATANLAYLAMANNDLPYARELAERALKSDRAIPYETHVAIDLELLGLIAIKEQQQEEAASRLGESLLIHRELGETAPAVESLELLALVFPAGRTAQAVQSWGSVAAFRQRHELPDNPEARELVEPAVENCRRELGERGFRDAWLEGFALPLEAAIDLALSVVESSAT
jgi:predicted ATPase/class 3 adenylate cyclase